MSYHREEARLLSLLQASTDLKGRGVSFLPGLESGVVIHYAGHVVGVWHAKGDGYEWTPALGGRTPYHAPSAEDAVEYIQRTLLAN